MWLCNGDEDQLQAEIGAVMLTPVSFDLRSEVVADTHVIAIRGELDLNTAEQLQKSLEAAISADGSSVLVDLCDCEFIDSTGIALLIRACHRLTESGEANRRFALCGLRDQVQRLYELTGLESSLPKFESREAALAALRS